MDSQNRVQICEEVGLFDIDAADLYAVKGGFGGGFTWGFGWGGGAGRYDGTTWETDIDGMCHIDGRYY